MVRGVRLVVTGFDAEGKNIWVSDGKSPMVSQSPAGKVLGGGFTSLWAIPKVPAEVHDIDAAETSEIWPDRDGVRFHVFEIPPKSVYRAHPELVPRGPDGKPVDVDAKEFRYALERTPST